MIQECLPAFIGEGILVLIRQRQDVTIFYLKMENVLNDKF